MERKVSWLDICKWNPQVFDSRGVQHPPNLFVWGKVRTPTCTLAGSLEHLLTSCSWAMALIAGDMIKF